MTIRPKRSYCHRCPVVAYFTHLCRVDTATITLWTAPFFSRRVSGLLVILLCFVEILVFNANSETPDLRRLILVYAVCQCPFYGTLYING